MISMRITNIVKVACIVFSFTTALTCVAQNADYKIIYENDTVIKTRVGGFSLDSRPVRRIIYEYTSRDADGKPATISGVMMIPSNINQELINGLIANPLKPNYILVMSDFIGYGSSSEYPSFYHSGDVNARNSLDGLLAARQILDDQQLPQGKYLFHKVALSRSMWPNCATWSTRIRGLPLPRPLQEAVLPTMPWPIRNMWRRIGARTARMWS